MSNLILLAGLFLAPTPITDERVIVRVRWSEYCEELQNAPVIIDSLAGICYPPPMPPIEQMPIFASWYNPALGGINCYMDTCDELAVAPLRESYYGHVVACPLGWTTWPWTTVVHIPGMAPRACLDTGGSITITYRTVYDPKRGFIDLWVIVLDFLEYDHLPYFAAELFWDWHTTRGYVPDWRQE